MTTAAALGSRTGNLRTMPLTMPEALEQLWAAIRAEHPDVPDATIGITAGRAPGCGAVQWSPRLPAIQLPAQTVEAGDTEVLTALLHQAAHGLLAARGAGQASDEGRYHDARFLAAAEEVGLDYPVGKPPVHARGYVDPQPRRATIERYRPQLAAIATARRTWTPPQPARRSQGRVMVRCSCPDARRFPITPSVLDRGPITCGICRQPFTRA